MAGKGSWDHGVLASLCRFWAWASRPPGGSYSNKINALSNELVINSTPEGERIALLQDKRLIEYHFDRNDTNYSVGDIFLGTVRKVMPGLNAAFVDIGYEKDAFLHHGDLGEQYPSLNKWVRSVQSHKAPPRADWKNLPSSRPWKK